MKVLAQQYGAVMVIKPDGPLAATDAEDFKEQFLQVLRENLGRVVLDASGIPVVDSKGLETLVELTNEIAQSGQALKLCAANRTVREVLELTGISAQFEHFEDVNSAVRSFL